MEELAAKVKFAFIEAWRLYTGLSYFDDLPKISGAFYIHKPKIYERKNTRTKNIGHVEIIAELPQVKPATAPEYITVIFHRSWHNWFRPKDYSRILGYIRSRIKDLTRRFPGNHRFFIYIICRRYTIGVLERHKLVFAKLPDNYVFRIILSYEKTPLKDISNYVHKRVERLLDPKLYYKSRYEIFGRPKRMAEYMLMLEALLNGNREVASRIAYLLHHTYRIQVTQLLDLQNNIYKTAKKQEQLQPAKQPAATLYI